MPSDASLNSEGRVIDLGNKNAIYFKSLKLHISASDSVRNRLNQCQ